MWSKLAGSTPDRAWCRWVFQNQLSFYAFHYFLTPTAEVTQQLTKTASNSCDLSQYLVEALLKLITEGNDVSVYLFQHNMYTVKSNDRPEIVWRFCIFVPHWIIQISKSNAITSYARRISIPRNSFEFIWSKIIKFKIVIFYNSTQGTALPPQTCTLQPILRINVMLFLYECLAYLRSLVYTLILASDIKNCSYLVLPDQCNRNNNNTAQTMNIRTQKTSTGKRQTHGIELKR